RLPWGPARAPSSLRTMNTAVGRARAWTLLGYDQLAFHQGRVTRERAEEGVIPTGLELAAGERRLGTGAAADHRRGGDHLGIAPGHVARRSTGLRARGGNRVHVRRLADDHVVAHRLRGHLADMGELDGDLRTRRGNRGGLQV